MSEKKISLLIVAAITVVFFLPTAYLTDNIILYGIAGAAAGVITGLYARWCTIRKGTVGTMLLAILLAESVRQWQEPIATAVFCGAELLIYAVIFNVRKNR